MKVHVEHSIRDWCAVCWTLMFRHLTTLTPAITRSDYNGIANVSELTIDIIMQNRQSPVIKGKRNRNDSRSLSNTRLMNDSSNFSSSLGHSSAFPVAASPPNGILNLRGHTLIAPNSTLARAIVMGNQESAYGHDESQKNATTTNRPDNLPTSKRVHDQRDNEGKKPISNLPALLNAQYYNEYTYEETLVPVKQVFSEADSASGPAPPPPPSPPTVPLQGRSAPHYYAYTNSRYREEMLHPPAQLSRAFQSSNAAELLSTDKVRRYAIRD